jgi:hypothetical protein
MREEVRLEGHEGRRAEPRGVVPERPRRSRDEGDEEELEERERQARRVKERLGRKRVVPREGGRLLGLLDREGLRDPRENPARSFASGGCSRFA